jgi:hypothetical protein
MIGKRGEDSPMASWPHHLPSGNQKRFWRDSRKQGGHSGRVLF